MGKPSKILNSLFWTAGEKIASQGIGFVIQIVLVRILLPEDFACLAIINAILNYLSIFVYGGISVAVVQKKDLTIKDLSTLTSISIATAFVLFVSLFLLAPIISGFYNVGDITSMIRTMGLLLLLNSITSIQIGILIRKMKFKLLFYRSLLALLLSGLVGIIMAFCGFGAWALVASGLTGALLSFIFLNLLPELRLSLGFSMTSAKELYSFSLKILGTNLVSMGGDTIRTLTIGKAYRPTQLAFFDRGLYFSKSVTQIVNTSLSSVLLPTFSRLQDDVHYMRDMSRRSVRLSSFAMIPILVFVAVVSRPLIGMILTDKWLPCAIYLSIFCFLRIPGIITSIDKQVFYAMGKSQIGLYYEIGLLIANLISLIIVIPYGPLAVAVGFTVIEYLGNMVLCYIASRVYDYSLIQRIKDLYLPVVNSVLVFFACGSIYFLHLNYICTLLSQFIVAVSVYLLLAKIAKDESLEYYIELIKSLFLSCSDKERKT